MGKKQTYESRCSCGSLLCTILDAELDGDGSDYFYQCRTCGKTAPINWAEDAVPSETPLVIGTFYCNTCSKTHTYKNSCPMVGHVAEPAVLGTSDGSTAAYYELPCSAKELQDLISYRDMNSQMGEIFRACYRYGQVSHSSKLRDAKKIKFYIEAEIARLEKYAG